MTAKTMTPPGIGLNRWRETDATVRRRARLTHVVKDVCFGDDRQVRCTCGKRFTGRTDQEMAFAFDLHTGRRVQRLPEARPDARAER